ncbi:hypothetical protein PSCICM_45380 [Pseudomonas cichorii]|uniref:Uncharacterized protein n=1 Tax=Pseudomonas cichorii TaxID=36746 RepID=A0ABQ1DT95_PSECI|nr:hypothetical protein PSCICM_45380 [Pseudomonas cichorii]GFM94255.1 hypothetical protein PSCICP_42270 [Pseudomonas cichorii]
MTQTGDLQTKKRRAGGIGHEGVLYRGIRAAILAEKRDRVEGKRQNRKLPTCEEVLDYTMIDRE